MSYNNKINYIDRLIDNDKFNRALVAIHNYVEKIFVNKYYSHKFLALPELDELCKKISFKKTNSLNHRIQDKVDCKKVNIFLATKLDFGGGHTWKLIEFINESSNDSVVILSEIQGKSYIKNFKDNLICHSKCKIILAPNFSFLEKYKFILNKLESFNINRIYLFNSHQDSILISVACLYFKKVYFYHHGDHNPSLGATLFMFHIDTTHSLNSLCQNYHKNTKICLLNENYSFDFMKHDFKNINVVSICKSNKINIIFLFHASFISRYTNKFIHIGNLNLLHKIIFKSLVFIFNIFRKNEFKIYENITNLRRILEIEKINIYFASFPNAAFLTLLEVSYLGIVSLINKNYLNTLLNNTEFLGVRSRFEYCSLSSLRKLLNKLRKQDVLELQNNIMNSLNQYKKKSVNRKKINYDHISLLSSYKRFLYLFSLRYYFRMIRRIFYL